MRDEDLADRGKTASHLVLEKDGLFFKFLNLTEEDGVTSDENPEKEILCHSLYEVLEIQELSAPTVLIEIPELGEFRIQVSPKIEGTKLTNYSKNLDKKNYSWQYIMALLLSLGDAKGDNYIVKQQGQIVSIDREMALSMPVFYSEKRGSLTGIYSTLFRNNREAMNPLVKSVVKILRKFSDKPEDIVLDLLRILDDSIPEQHTIVSLWCRKISEHDRYNFFTPPKAKEDLFWKMLRFYKHWRIIQDCIQREDRTSHQDLLIECHKNLAQYLRDRSEETEHTIIYDEKETNLPFWSERRLRFALLTDLLDDLKTSDFYRLRSVLFQLQENPENEFERVSSSIKNIIIGRSCETEIWPRPVEQFLQKEYAKKYYEKAAENNDFSASILAWIYMYDDELRDLEGAFILHSELAQKGVADSQNRLAWMLENGVGTTTAADPNDEEVLDLYSEAGRNGSLLALFRLGQISEDNRNWKDALNYYGKAARIGNYRAQCKLGQIYENGELGQPSDLGRAFKYYEAAADIGEFKSQYRLGKVFEKGELGQTPDPQKTLLYYQMSADSGNYRALFRLGQIHERGLLEQKADPIEALKYYQKASMPIQKKNLIRISNLHVNDETAHQSREIGHFRALNRLAQIYEHGQLGQEPNLQEALKLYKEAADKGEYNAQYKLEQIFENGELEETQNNIKAFDWYKKSAETGGFRALYKLGEIYEYGQLEQEINHIKALEYYKSAADKGEHNALCRLGQVYENGELGEIPDREKSLGYYQKAAEKENPKALFKLGQIEEQAQNFAKAYALYKASADKRDDAAREKVRDFHARAHALYELGQNHYRNGNKREAFSSFEQAVELSSHPAMDMLGQMYLEGILGISKQNCKKQAIRLFKAAAEKGNAHAVNHLREMGIDFP